jgi:putative SOS response-associated peptidase YedK
MCGRYSLRTALEELARVFGFIERPNLVPCYNIAPTMVLKPAAPPEIWRG